MIIKPSVFSKPLMIPFNKLAVMATDEMMNFYQISPSAEESFFDDFCEAFEVFIKKVEEGFSCDVLDHNGHSQIICPI